MLTVNPTYSIDTYNSQLFRFPESHLNNKITSKSHKIPPPTCPRTKDSPPLAHAFFPTVFFGPNHFSTYQTQVHGHRLGPCCATYRGHRGRYPCHTQGWPMRHHGRWLGLEMNLNETGSVNRASNLLDEEVKYVWKCMLDFRILLEGLRVLLTPIWFWWVFCLFTVLGIHCLFNLLSFPVAACSNFRSAPSTYKVQVIRQPRFFSGLKWCSVQRLSLHHLTKLGSMFHSQKKQSQWFVWKKGRKQTPSSSTKGNIPATSKVGTLPMKRTWHMQSFPRILGVLGVGESTLAIASFDLSFTTIR